MKTLMVFALLTPAGCMTDEKLAPKHPSELCVIRPSDKMCWFNKETGQGITIDNLDGYFAQDPADLDEMLFKLNQCKDKL